jgi:hypothetical protein
MCRAVDHNAISAHCGQRNLMGSSRLWSNPDWVRLVNLKKKPPLIVERWQRYIRRLLITYRSDGPGIVAHSPTNLDGKRKQTPTRVA